MATKFDTAKKNRLSSADLSRKGSIDEPIRELVDYINQNCNYFTTSSCSGRVVVLCQENGKAVKSGCKWLLVSHELVDEDALFSTFESNASELVLKFEPFILHVSCRMLENAQLMHRVAINSGFRNSGITVGKSGNITMAVRSSLSLEVPLSSNSQLFVDKQYAHFLSTIIAKKFAENAERIQRFSHNLEIELNSNIKLNQRNEEKHNSE